jgi:hypothetical protein
VCYETSVGWNSTYTDVWHFLWMIFSFTISQNFLSCEFLYFFNIEAVRFVSFDSAAIYLTLLPIFLLQRLTFFLTYNQLQMIRPVIFHLHSETTRLKTEGRVEGYNLLLSNINTYNFWVYLTMKFKLRTPNCEYSCRGSGKATLWMAQVNMSLKL